MKVNTLFPSKAEEGQVKGGVILVKLKKLSSDGSLKLKVSYQDRNGVRDSDEAEVNVGEVNMAEAKARFLPEQRHTQGRPALSLCRPAQELDDR